MSRFHYRIVAAISAIMVLGYSGLVWICLESDLAIAGAFFAICVIMSYVLLHHCLHKTGVRSLVRVAWYTPLFLFVSIPTMSNYDEVAVWLAIGGVLVTIYLLRVILKELDVTNWLQLILWPALGLITDPGDHWWLRMLCVALLIRGVTGFIAWHHKRHPSPPKVFIAFLES